MSKRANALSAILADRRPVDGSLLAKAERKELARLEKALQAKGAAGMDAKRLMALRKKQGPLESVAHNRILRAMVKAD